MTLMYQQYTILVSTIFSIRRDQLIIFDVNFAVQITSPPFSVVLISAALSLESTNQTWPFSRCGEKWGRCLRYCTFLYIILWLILGSTMALSSTAFKDSYEVGCGPATLGPWLKGLFWGFLQLVLPALYYVQTPRMWDMVWTTWEFVNMGICTFYYLRHLYRKCTVDRHEWRHDDFDACRSAPIFKRIV